MKDIRMRLLILFVFIANLTWAQVNQTDSNGLRQGPWEKKSYDGKLIYKGAFKDGKPIGEWTRYHRNGVIKARMTYQTDSDSVHSQLYDELGKKVAQGNYIQQKKEGKWIYFAQGRMVGSEEFKKDLKNGTSITYYPSGEMMERSEWINGLKDGNYETFFKNGKPYFQCKMKMDMRHGLCLINDPNGIPELEAEYKNNLRHGSWKYYDKNGGIRYTLIYVDGDLQNPEVRDSISSLQMEQYEKNKGNIVDPEKFMDDPSGYMRTMKIR